MEAQRACVMLHPSQVLHAANMRLPFLLAGTPSVAVPNRAAMAPGLLERAAITHCAGCAANNRPIVVSAEMHAISQRGLEGGARFGQVLLAAGGKFQALA